MSQKTFPISKKKANSALIQILSGSALDEFRVHSTQLEMCFLTDHLVDGRLIAVRINFDCSAFVSKGDEDKQYANACKGNDFFVERAQFLSDIYALIGRNVISVRISEKFDLRITVESGEVMNLYLRPEDLEDDDWLWKISLDDGASNIVNSLSSIYCLSEGGSVSLWYEN